MTDTSDLPDFHVHVSMIGARQHYAVARAFERVDRLRAFYTDLWIPPGIGRFVRGLGAPGRRLAGRYHPDLPKEKVHTPGSMVRRTLGMLLGGTRAGRADYGFYCRQGRDFAEGVRDRILEGLPDPHRQFFLGFTSGCLETLQALNAAGMVTIVDQIDPLVTEFEIVREERGKWPGWEDEGPPISSAYVERVQAEWAEAAWVLVNSEWSSRALVRQGVPAQKLMVVPQAYEGLVSDRAPDYDGKRPLRVLWVGTVCLRKGIPYFLEALRGLGSSVEARVVGPIGVDRSTLTGLSANVSVEGPIPRSEISGAYRWADVYVLPTLSDGFAITQLEAMAQGLPVVTTPNCGRVVDPGVNGLIVRAGDAPALESALANLAADASRVRDMSRQALQSVGRFSLSAYAGRVLNRIASAGHLPTVNSYSPSSSM